MVKLKKLRGLTNMFKRTKELSRGLILVLAFALSVGCAGLGGNMVTPKTDGEKLAYAEATLTGLTVTAVQLNNARIIPLEKIKDIERAITKAELAIRIGRIALEGKDAKTVLEQLSAANKLLIELTVYIESKREAYFSRPLPPIPVEGEPLIIEDEPS